MLGNSESKGFLHLNERNDGNDLNYIYIHENLHLLKFNQKPQGGKPSLKPSRSLRSPSWTEKNKNHFPEYEMLFSLITDFRDAA